MATAAVTPPGERRATGWKAGVEAIAGDKSLAGRKPGVNRCTKEEPKEPVTLKSILAKENLKAAWSQVEANDGAAGVDGRHIERSLSHIQKHWEKIETALRTGDYEPEAVRAVKIPKANGGVRTLGIPMVLDRLIQQAIHQQLSPVWEPDFGEHSYGFRPGRSAQDTM